MVGARRSGPAWVWARLGTPDAASILQCWVQPPKVIGRARLRTVGTVPWDGAVEAPRAGVPLALPSWEAAEGQLRQLELNWAGMREP